MEMHSYLRCMFAPRRQLPNSMSRRDYFRIYRVMKSLMCIASQKLLEKEIYNSNVFWNVVGHNNCNWMYKITVPYLIINIFEDWILFWRLNSSREMATRKRYCGIIKNYDIELVLNSAIIIGHSANPVLLNLWRAYVYLNVRLVLDQY